MKVVFETYLCIDDWCEDCGGRIYRIGRQLNENEYKQNNFIRTNPRVIIIGKECCDCKKKLIVIRQHVTCTDSEGQWWYYDVDTINYEHNPSYGERWFRCTACAIERYPEYIVNQFSILGLESGEVGFCMCGKELIKKLGNVAINKKLKLEPTFERYIEF